VAAPAAVPDLLTFSPEVPAGTEGGPLNGQPGTQAGSQGQWCHPLHPLGTCCLWMMSAWLMTSAKGVLRQRHAGLLPQWTPFFPSKLRVGATCWT